MGQRLRKSLVQIRRVLDANSENADAALGSISDVCKCGLRSSYQGFGGFAISRLFA